MLSDAQYVAFLVKAARRLNRVLKLTGTTSAIVVNTTTGEITSPSNDDLEDLLVLQAECLILQRNVNEEIDNGEAGVLIKDGEQTVDTSALSRLREAHLNSDHSPCAELKLAIIQYKLDNQETKMVW